MVTFEEALRQTENQVRSLLLGNGFSIAASRNFCYYSLRERTVFPEDSYFDALFDRYDTNDFEKILMALTYARDVNRIAGHEEIAQNFEADRNKLSECFVTTLQNIHPRNLNSATTENRLTREQFDRNCIFLQHFVNNTIQGCIFTLNYDIMLYWSILQGNLTRLLRDSFSNSCEYNDYFTPKKDCKNYTSSTNVFYLHGALHLRSSKYNDTYKIGNVDNILDELAEDLNGNLFPTIVFEGTTEEKKQKIDTNEYLTIAYNTFSNAYGNLFTYGFSFSQNDQHIIDAITNSRISRLYVGLYGDEDSEENANIRASCSGINEKRKSTQAIEIKYYNTTDASPW